MAYGYDKDYEFEDRRDAAEELFSKVLSYVKKAVNTNFYDFLLVIRKQGYVIDKYEVKPIKTDPFGNGQVVITLELSNYDSKLNISKRLELKL